MHTLFLLLALLLAVGVGALGAALLWLAPAGGRRSLALAVLAAPLFVLALAGLHVVPRFWTACAPLVGWDLVGSVVLLVAIGGIALGGLVLNVARLLMAERQLAACAPLSDAATLARLSTLAERLRIDPPAVRMLAIHVPLAMTGGLHQPAIVLSRWILKQLDRWELEAVLAHELAHVARRDPLIRWLGRVLRDATIYLPSSWYAFRVLETDEELEADALAVELTGRPLAMASALGKVWQHGSVAPRAAGSLSGYAGPSALLERRLMRLIEGRAHRAPALPGQLLAGGTVLTVGGLTPRLLAAGAAMFPLMCSLRPL
jgi:beta-lactamase regulating signal transducer with metallopeptidase domain